MSDQPVPPTAPIPPQAAQQIVAGFHCVQHADGRIDIALLPGMNLMQIQALRITAYDKLGALVAEEERRQLEEAELQKTPWGRAKLRLRKGKQERAAKKAEKEARKRAGAPNLAVVPSPPAPVPAEASPANGAVHS